MIIHRRLWFVDRFDPLKFTEYRGPDTVLSPDVKGTEKRLIGSSFLMTCVENGVRTRTVLRTPKLFISIRRLKLWPIFTSSAMFIWKAPRFMTMSELVEPSVKFTL